MKIKDIVTEYLNHLKALGRSYHTVKGTKYDLERFVRFLETEQTQ